VTVFETEVTRIADVLAVRAATSGEELREIHVLAAPGRLPQEIASDVRSLAALSGIDLRDDAVHVVQLQASPVEESSTGVEPAPGAGIVQTPEPVVEPPPRERRPSRIEVDGVVVVTGEGMARAITTVRRDGEAATGTAVFVPAAAAARRGVAEATMGALLEILDAKDDMAVDSALVVSLPPHELAVVTIAVVGAHGEATLVGAVLVRSGGVNDAIARAVLDATNRWFEGHA
jgi:hypothetical protein